MALTQLLQEKVRDGAKRRLAGWRLAKIEPRPMEFVLLVTDHPGTMLIETKIILDSSRHLDRRSLGIRFDMRNRNNREHLANRRDHDTWSQLPSRIFTAFMLTPPEIPIWNDLA